MEMQPGSSSLRRNTAACDVPCRYDGGSCRLVYGLELVHVMVPSNGNADECSYPAARKTLFVTHSF